MSDVSVAVMTLILRVERGAPPQRTDALEAAAAASIAALRTTEASGDAFGSGLMARWQAAPRKIVRRARGLIWQQAVELADARLVVGSAEILGFNVIESSDTPDLIRSMQVSGLELDDLGEPRELIEGSPIIWLNPHVTMTTGKAMAQAGHGATLAWECASEAARSEWLLSGLRMRVRTARIQLWPSVSEQGPLVTDGGYTEVTPGSVTAAVALPDGFALSGGHEHRELELAHASGENVGVH